jgi:hypothetical protein
MREQHHIFAGLVQYRLHEQKYSFVLFMLDQDWFFSLEMIRSVYIVIHFLNFKYRLLKGRAIYI